MMTEECREQGAGGNGKRAVILIGHGSRAVGADDAMDLVAGRLRAATAAIVEVCRMSGRGVPFAATFEQCIRQGATEVIVLPYFLHLGVHLRQDLPEMLCAVAGKYPAVRLILGKHLGYDDVLVSLVEKRLRESASLCDVRQLPQLPIDRDPNAAEGARLTEEEAP